jgi:putative ABC transport system permease protein
MTGLRVLLSKFTGLFRKARLEQRLDEDVRAHLEMLTEENRQRGMEPEEARYAGLRQFGNVSSMKEECRERWSIRIIEELVQDIRYGLRQLRRNPGFTAVAVLTLALGIGATTAIFSVIYGGLINPLPYKDCSRLAVLSSYDPTGNYSEWAKVPPTEFLEFQRQNSVFDQVIGGSGEGMLLTGPHRLTSWFGGLRLTPNTFQVLGMEPILGRTFTTDDAKPGAPAVVVLSYRVWQKEFGGSPTIIGQTIVLNKQATTVIGVMPKRFKWYGGAPGPSGWLPADFSLTEKGEQSQTTPVVGHLKPGVTFAQASADLKVIAKRLARADPKSYPKGIIYSVVPLTKAFTEEESRRTLVILLGGVTLLLLIACVNVANILLARASTRHHEIAVRAALGAGRARLVRQFLLESLLLAIGGAVIGCLIAWCGLNDLVSLIPIWYMPYESTIRMSVPVLLFTAGIAVLSTLLFGLAPAVLAVKKDIQAPLKASARAGGASRGHHRLSNLLVVSQVILSLVLLTGAGLLFHSFWTLRYLNLGYNISNALSAWAPLPAKQYKTVEQRNQFYLEILRRVRALPGVVSATLDLPQLNAAIAARVDFPGQSGGGNQDTWFRLVGDQFFKTLGIPLLAGRTISEGDLVQNRHVVVVNRAFVNKYSAGENPLGRHIRLRPPAWFPPISDNEFEIVGIVADTMHADEWEPTVKPQIFLPATICGLPWERVVVRTAGNPTALLNAVQKQFAAVDNGLPVSADLLRHDFLYWYTAPRFLLAMLAGFALLGMVLVSIGVYGVLSYAVSQRTQEFGIRMALGAQVADVRRMVLMWGLRWLAIGIGIGVPASIVLEKVLRNRIWGIKSADPLTMVVVSLVLASVGLAACYVPARRASKVDPMVALRYD